MLLSPVRPISTVHLDDLALKVTKSLSGLTHFVIRVVTHARAAAVTPRPGCPAAQPRDAWWCGVVGLAPRPPRASTAASGEPPVRPPRRRARQPRRRSPFNATTSASAAATRSLSAAAPYAVEGGRTHSDGQVELSRNETKVNVDVVNIQTNFTKQTAASSRWRESRVPASVAAKIRGLKGTT